METNDVAPPRPRKRRPWLFKVGLELLLITAAVFLALLADEWRQARQDQALAHQSLRRFRQEIAQNRERVSRVVAYHDDALTRLRAYLDTPAAARRAEAVALDGIRPVWFETTAWDLALANESLAHVDDDLAFSLTRIYTLQKAHAALSQGMMQSMYVNPPQVNVDSFFSALVVYYGDVTGMEPTLIKAYDEMLPRLDAALAR